MSKNERQEVLRALDAWDRSVFREVTSHQSPLLDRALPALTTLLTARSSGWWSPPDWLRPAAAVSVELLSAECHRSP